MEGFIKEMANDLAGYSLYLMRHGIAVERGSSDFSDDAARPLTPKGKKKLEEIAAGLIRIGFAVDWILTSPLVRAEETAKIVADSLASKVPLDVCDALKPGGSHADLKAFLGDHPGRNSVLLVGHEPDLSTLAARLIGAGRHANLAFKKGGCCLIEWPDPSADRMPDRMEVLPFETNGTLVWWLTPRLLRGIAGRGGE
jgi:phosphohistidine phosphatase